MAYAVAATVRALNTEITVSVADDTAITTLSTSAADPYLDSALASLGAPFATAPSLVKLMASRLVAAEIVSARLQQDDEPSAWAADQRAMVESMIERLLSGELVLDPSDETTEETAPPRIITVSDPTSFLPGTVFVGDVTNWAATAETRED